MLVQSMSQEDPLEKGMITHSSFLAWRIPWTEEPSRLQSMGLQGVRHDGSDLAHTHTHNVVIWASPDGASGKESAGQCRRLGREDPLE